MAKKQLQSKELVRFFKKQSRRDSELREDFILQTEKLAVARLRLCLGILFVLFLIFFLLDVFSEGRFILTPPAKVCVVFQAILFFFGSLSLVPQFRRNCYAFTILLAVFIGSFTTLMQHYAAQTQIDQMSTFTLFFIMMGFLMPWGAAATAGICIPLYLFYPISLLSSPHARELDVVFRSSLYLFLYLGVAMLAAHMNEAMRFKEFALKKKMEGENRLLQDYQVRLKRAYERVETLAVMDTLTGAYNRSFFTRWMKNDVYKDKECQDVFSVIMFDIDGFKTINDVAGHQQGDRILQLISKKVMETLPQNHKLFRYGGDEFCIILPGRPLKTGILVAEDVRRSVEMDPNLFVALPDKESIHVTLSVGVGCESSAASIDTDFLIKWVDTALLESKRQGRNCVHVFDPAERRIEPISKWIS